MASSLALIFSTLATWLKHSWYFFFKEGKDIQQVTLAADLLPRLPPPQCLNHNELKLLKNRIENSRVLAPYTGALLKPHLLISSPRSL